MHRWPHEDYDGMEVRLSAAEVEQSIGGVADTDRRIAFGLAMRSGLQVGEVASSPRPIAPNSPHVDRVRRAAVWNGSFESDTPRLRGQKKSPTAFSMLRRQQMITSAPSVTGVQSSPAT